MVEILGTDYFNTVCGVMVWNRNKIEKHTKLVYKRRAELVFSLGSTKAYIVCVVVQDFWFQHLGYSQGESVQVRSTTVSLGPKMKSSSCSIERL